MADETQPLDDASRYATFSRVRPTTLRHALRNINALDPTLHRYHVFEGEREEEGTAAGGAAGGGGAAQSLFIIGASSNRSPQQKRAQDGRQTTRMSPNTAGVIGVASVALTHVSQTPEESRRYSPELQAGVAAEDAQNGENPLLQSSTLTESMMGSSGEHVNNSTARVNTDEDEGMVIIAPPSVPQSSESMPKSSLNHPQHDMYEGGTLRVQELSLRESVYDEAKHMGTILSQQQAPIVGKPVAAALQETLDDGIDLTYTEEERQLFAPIGGGCDAAERSLLDSDEEDEQEEEGEENGEDLVQTAELEAASSHRPSGGTATSPSPGVAPARVGDRDDEDDDAPIMRATKAAHLPSITPLKDDNGNDRRKQQPCYSVGQAVEGRWGGGWYPAVVVSFMSGAAEIRWVKDGSTQHSKLKDIRLPKKKNRDRNTSLAAAAEEATRVEPSASGSPSHHDSKRFTSTQMVRMMDEDEAMEEGVKSKTKSSSGVRGQAEDTVNHGGSPSSMSRSLRKRERHEDAATTTNNDGMSTPQRATAPPDGVRHGQPGSGLIIPPTCAVGDDNDFSPPTAAERAQAHPQSLDTTPQDHHFDSISASPAIVIPAPPSPSMLRSSQLQRLMSTEYSGDCSTPPSTVMYLSDAAIQELPSDTRRIIQRMFPRVMVVSSLRSVVSWAANVTYQQSVPFIFLVSATSALKDGSSREQYCIDIALALGITPVDCQWISKALTHHNLALSQDEFLLSRFTGSSTVRHLTVARCARVLYGDRVLFTHQDADVELLIEACGGAVLFTLEEALDTALSSPPGVSNEPARLFVYAPPGRRVSSVMRESLVERFVQLEMPWLRQAIRRHFLEVVATRPVSSATAHVGGVGGAGSGALMTAMNSPAATKMSANVSVSNLGPTRLLFSTIHHDAVVVDQSQENVRKRPRGDDEDHDECATGAVVAIKSEEVGGGGGVTIGMEQEEEEENSKQSCSRMHPMTMHRDATGGDGDSSAANVVRRRLPADLRADLRIAIPSSNDNSRRSAPDALLEPTTIACPGGYHASLGDDFYFCRHGQDDIDIGRIVAFTRGGDGALLQLYRVDSVTHLRRRDGDHGRKKIERYTTLCLTPDRVEVPLDALDFETPLFVINEKQTEHLYILCKPEKSQSSDDGIHPSAPSGIHLPRDGGAGASSQIQLTLDERTNSMPFFPTSSILRVVNHSAAATAGHPSSSTEIMKPTTHGVSSDRLSFSLNVEVGSRIQFQLPSGAHQWNDALRSMCSQDGSNLLCGIVEDIKRVGEGSKGIVLLVRAFHASDVNAATAAGGGERVVITPDMIRSVCTHRDVGGLLFA